MISKIKNIYIYPCDQHTEKTCSFELAWHIHAIAAAFLRHVECSEPQRCPVCFWMLTCTDSIPSFPPIKGRECGERNLEIKRWHGCHGSSCNNSKNKMPLAIPSALLFNPNHFFWWLGWRKKEKEKNITRKEGNKSLLNMWVLQMATHKETAW